VASVSGVKSKVLEQKCSTPEWADPTYNTTKRSVNSYLAGRPCGEVQFFTRARTTGLPKQLLSLKRFATPRESRWAFTCEHRCFGKQPERVTYKPRASWERCCWHVPDDSLLYQGRLLTFLKTLGFGGPVSLRRCSLLARVEAPRVRRYGLPSWNER